jgi:hypothetical protein
MSFTLKSWRFNPSVSVISNRVLVAMMLTVLPVHGAAFAQGASAPLPPQRPFDLRLPEGTQPMRIPGAAPLASASVTMIAPLPPARPASGLALAPNTEDEEDEAPRTTPLPQKETAPVTPRPSMINPPASSQASVVTPREWPRVLQGQSEQSDPVISDEHLERRGLTTDPGTSIKCLPAPLRSVLNQVISRYGAVHVTSTWRPGWRARRGSYHRRCEAVDFRVEGIAPREALRFVATLPETGGRKVYWNGLLHVDTGPIRSW